MSLPFLPLCSTGGTNDSEAGNSNTPHRPTPAAAGLMDSALGMPELEIVRNILEQIHADDADNAKEQACSTVDSWLSANRSHLRLRDEDAVWKTLLRNVFPNAPAPASHDGEVGWLPENYVPSNNKELFYAMCNRYRHLRLAEAAFARLLVERDEAERVYLDLESELVDFMQARPGFTFHSFSRKEEPAPDDAGPGLTAQWKAVARDFRKARRRWFRLDDRMRQEWDNVIDARNFVRAWVPIPQTLRPRREPARPDFHLRNEPDTSDEDDEDDP